MLFCGNKSHNKCLKIDEADVKILSTYANFRFICDRSLILEGTSKIDTLKESVQKCLTFIEKQNDLNLNFNQAQRTSFSGNVQKTDTSCASIVGIKKSSDSSTQG